MRRGGRSIAAQVLRGNQATETSLMTADAWQPEAVIASAKELIHSSNYEKVGDARASVDNVIAQWVLAATTDPKLRADAALWQQAEQAIVRIWSLYAALEIELRQFKQATKVFEGGASCPVAGPSAAFWLQYADFCIERKKFSNARKVFVRALRAVPETHHSDLWTRFHAFVVKELDPKMTLEALQAQVFPDKVPLEQSTARVEPTHAGSDAGSGHLPTGHAQNGEAVGALQNGSSTPAVQLDPNLAFIDKEGGAVPPPTVAPGKRKADNSVSRSPPKQAKLAPADHSSAAMGSDDYKSFLEIPTTLPITPGCPHLLFDQMETQRVIENELLEKLSHVLSDNAVFEGVKDLYDNQRQRDRDMLYRWQDLVGMQMKEGSELFARHMDVEKSVSEPRELIESKAKHLEQRREFVHRCQMSQQQFIEICEMDRVSALKAQQISLENLKIPEMSVTNDPDHIELQRAIVGLILEAEKLSREESAKKAAEPPRGKKPHFTPKPGPPRARSDSRDRDFRGGGRGGRGGGSNRGGGSFGRNGGSRRPFADSPPRGGRGQPKRYDGYGSQPAGRPFDNPPRQSHPPQGSGQRKYAPGPGPGRGYPDHQRDRPAHFDRGQDRRPQSYNRGPPPEVVAPPLRFGDGPPQHGAPGYGPPNPIHRPGAHVGGQDDRGSRHVEYERGGRYGGPQQNAGSYSAPPPHYGGEPNAQIGRYGEPVAPMNRYGGEAVAPPSRYGSEPVGHPQYSAPPNAYEYAPPNSAPYGYQSHPPPQQHQPHPVQSHAHYGQPAPVYSQPPPASAYQQPPLQQHLPNMHHQQQQPVYGAPPVYHQQHPPHHPPPHHQQQQQHRQAYQTSPPRGGSGRGGYDRPRRGGGGGGRYGRR